MVDARRESCCRYVWRLGEGRCLWHTNTTDPNSADSNTTNANTTDANTTNADTTDANTTDAYPNANANANAIGRANEGRG